MEWLQNPYQNGDRTFIEDIADGVLRYHKKGYIDGDNNVYDICGNFLYNEGELAK